MLEEVNITERWDRDEVEAEKMTKKKKQIDGWSLQHYFCWKKCCAKAHASHPSERKIKGRGNRLRVIYLGRNVLGMTCHQ